MRRSSYGGPTLGLVTKRLQIGNLVLATRLPCEHTDFALALVWPNFILGRIAHRKGPRGRPAPIARKKRVGDFSAHGTTRDQVDALRGRIGYDRAQDSLAN